MSILVDWYVRSTHGVTGVIPNISWKERQYAAHIGIPSERLSSFPGFGIQIRLRGFDFRFAASFGWIASTMFSLSAGGTDFTPSNMHQPKKGRV